MKVTREGIENALKAFMADNPGSSYSIAEDGDKKFRFMPTGSPTDADVLIWELEGSLKCSNADFGLNFTEYLKPAKGPSCISCPPEACKRPPNGRSSSLAPLVKPQSNMAVRDIQVADLTMDDIKNYLCSDATDQEAFMFLKLCQARNLNPFTREAYLIKYGGKASMIVGKEAFTRKAEQNSQFDGFSAGIIVKQKDGSYADLVGTFYDDSEDKLVGGWAEVCRKDRKEPFIAKVSMKEYAKAQATWKDMPATMIRKIALVSALREAFPSDLSGCYDQAEIDYEVAE